MSGPLQDLLAVQDLDLALDQLRHRRSHLPEREELVALEGQADAQSRRLSEVESARAELGGRQSGVEAELAATEQRAAAIDKRMYGGDVSTSRDLQAMSAELEQLKHRASSLEDAVIEVMEATEPLDAEAQQLTSDLEALAARRVDTSARLKEASAILDGEVAQAEDRRRAAAAAVPDSLLATYEGLRARLGGVGVARLSGNRCGGCHLTLSAMELDHLRHLPEGEIYTCEQCARILVP